MRRKCGNISREYDACDYVCIYKYTHTYTHTHTCAGNVEISREYDACDYVYLNIHPTLSMSSRG